MRQMISKQSKKQQKKASPDNANNSSQKKRKYKSINELIQTSLEQHIIDKQYKQFQQEDEKLKAEDRKIRIYNANEDIRLQNSFYLNSLKCKASQGANPQFPWGFNQQKMKPRSAADEKGNAPKSKKLAEDARMRRQ